MVKPVSAPRAVEKVREKVGGCEGCHLVQMGHGPVPMAHEGRRAPYVFIGEAPGFDEDQKKVPFIGQAGRFLRESMRKVGIQEKNSAFMNVISCRPPNNRDPQPGEVEACRGNLKMQLAVANPVVVFLLGKVALGQFRPDLNVTFHRGRPFVVTNGHLNSKLYRVFIPTFHPAYVMRKKSEQDNFVEDLKQGKWRYRQWRERGSEGLFDKFPEDMGDECNKPQCKMEYERIDEGGVGWCRSHIGDGKAPVPMREGALL